MKKIINTKLHGALDYLAGFTLLLPWLVNFHGEQPDTWILAFTGFAVITLSMLTNYELSFIRLIPMRFHLFADALVGLFLIALPFLFPMYHYYLYWPVVLGAGELIIVALSSARPFVNSRRDENITQPPLSGVS